MEVQVMNSTTGISEPKFEEILPCESSAKENVPKVEVLWTQTCGSPDALTAVKLDPAVLEAQVTLEKEKKPAVNHTDEAKPTNSSQTCEDNKPTSTCASSSTSSSEDFEQMVCVQRDALQSLAPGQLGLLLKYVAMLRRQRATLQRSLECAFCKNNGEPISWYVSHALKDWRGRVLCPVLRAFRCPRCGATGDRAHTIKYCPENNNAELRGLDAFEDFQLFRD